MTDLNAWHRMLLVRGSSLATLTVVAACGLVISVLAAEIERRVALHRLEVRPALTARNASRLMLRGSVAFDVLRSTTLMFGFWLAACLSTWRAPEVMLALAGASGPTRLTVFLFIGVAVHWIWFAIFRLRVSVRWMQHPWKELAEERQSVIETQSAKEVHP